MRPPTPKATVNTTDPDSRFVRGNGRTLQGYNAQAAATLGQVVVAAELTQQANDLQQLAPMLAAIRTTLTSAGIDAWPQRLAADSGYWPMANVSPIPDAPELLIPPARHGKPRTDGKPSESKSDSLRAAMLARLASEEGKASYAQRSRTIEPVFGQVKTVQGGWREPLRVYRRLGSLSLAVGLGSSLRW
jgi:Transposase DDE domain